MKKLIVFLLKFAALLAVLAAAAFAVVAYWDKITEVFCWVKGKVTGKKGCVFCSSEFDDFAD